MVRRALWLLLLFPIAYLGYCTTHIPSGPDVDVANQVGKYIATGYGRFDDPRSVERTGKGKIAFTSPGSDRSPTLILYEVTSAEDIEMIESLARKALTEVPEAKEIRLQFYESQNLTISPNGGASRGWESAFRKTRIARE